MPSRPQPLHQHCGDRRLGPGIYAATANAELVTVVSLGIMVLDDQLTPERAIGGGLIVSGIVVHSFFRWPAPV
jgi:drug/metabolite transporter (DMT)-like permease